VQKPQAFPQGVIQSLRKKGKNPEILVLNRQLHHQQFLAVITNKKTTSNNKQGKGDGEEAHDLPTHVSDTRVSKL